MWRKLEVASPFCFPFILPLKKSGSGGEVFPHGHSYLEPASCDSETWGLTHIVSQASVKLQGCV